MGAIVVAAGAGTRLGAGDPKGLRLLAGEPLVVHATRRMLDARASSVVVVVPVGCEARFAAVLDEYGVTAAVEAVVVAGGAERQESVRRGLAQLSPGLRQVLVHDAARPLVPAAVVQRVLAALADGAVAVVPAVPVADTIRMVERWREGGIGSRLVDRSLLRAVQTPQGFDREVLVEAHRAAAEHGWRATDDAALCELLGQRVVLVEGDRRSVKVTDLVDLLVAEALARDVP